MFLLRLFAVILFFLIFLFFIKRNIQKSILGYYTIINISLAIISIFVIENGIYILELDQVSYSTGGIFKLILYVTLFLFVFYKVYDIKNDNTIREPKGLLNNTCYKFLPAISFVLLFYLYVDLFKSGIPLINSSLPSKYNYYAYVSTLPFCSNFYTLISFYFPIFWGIYFSNENISRRKKAYSIIYIAFSCLYLLFIGFKVSGIRTALVGFLIPIVYRNYAVGKIKIDIKFINKIIKIVLVFVVALIINYSIFSNGMSVTEKLKSRMFALTSHMWWIVDEYRCENIISTTEIFDNISENTKLILAGESVYSSKIGVVKLMQHFVPHNLSNYYLANNTRIAASFITVSIYDYGYIFTIFIIISYAIIYAIIVKQFGKCILNGNVIEIILIYKLLIYFETFLWASGTLTEFFNIENFCIILFLVFYRILTNKQIEKIEKVR